MNQPHRLYYVVLVCLSFPLFALGASPKTSKGITADGRVIVVRYGTSPPWAADIIKEVRPHISASDRAGHHEGEGFFRVILDSDTGTVRRVVVIESSGYAGIDQSVIEALRQWKLRPSKWKQFEIHVGLWLRSRGSNQSMEPTASRRVGNFHMTRTLQPTATRALARCG